MKTLFLLFFCHLSSSVKHSLFYFATGSSGVPNLPEFMGTAELMEIQVNYCDSNKTRSNYPSFWEKVNEVDPQISQWYKQICFATAPLSFQEMIDSLKEHNPNEAVHILQFMGGCEWGEETGNVRFSVLSGYNGEDFMKLDSTKLTWISETPLADIIKPMWDADLAGKTYLTHFLTQTCPERLEKFMAIYPLNETERPSVSLLQKTPSSPVRCHATGFYSSRALMFWRKDGEEIHENVEHGEILPNHDETFQMSVDLNVFSIAPDDWRRYDCVFQLSGGENNIPTILDKTVIRTNWVPPSPSGGVVGVVVSLSLLVLGITGFLIWKRFRHRKPSASSDQTADLDQNSETELKDHAELP